jgi:hypothetical protein
MFAQFVTAIMKNTFLLLVFLATVFTSYSQELLDAPFINFENPDQAIDLFESIVDKNSYPVNYVSTTRKYSYNNRLGLGGDATFFNITSDDVNVTQGTGWSVNFETRGDFRDDFDLIYSLGIFNHNFSVNENVTNDKIDMSTLGVEIKFLLAWKIAQSDYFSIEAGPALQLNGELKIGNEERYGESFIGGSNPVAIQEFQNTMPVNLNGVIGFSGGARNFRVTAHYHYSLVDSLTGTNLIGDDIDGNFSFLSVGVRFYF